MIRVHCTVCSADCPIETIFKKKLTFCSSPPFLQNPGCTQRKIHKHYWLQYHFPSASFTQATAVAGLNFFKVRDRKSSFSHTATYRKNLFFSRLLDERSSTGRLSRRFNQIFHYTRCIMPKRLTSLRGPSQRHCARATQLHSKKRCRGGETSATMCPI